VHCDEVPPVLADASQLEQILINFATNAMQAMHNGPGHIDIRLDTVVLDATLAGAHLVLEALHARHPERTVRITVSDTGPGMDAATKERIFEPFFTTKPVGEGTGLGLSVVHGIVQGHEGAITVDSEPGKGTTFTVYLPVAEVEVSTQPVDPGTEASPALVLDGGPSILYLDDDESLVFLVERLLKRRGYRVAAHTRQEDALQALRADPAAVDLVLTDYNMPGMSGLDVAREARAIRPDLPVAVTSGFIDEALRAQAEGAGVRELIFKADEVEVFCDAVQRLLQAVQQKTA
jgi:CheY-like chemotaxis protein